MGGGDGGEGGGGGGGGGDGVYAHKGGRVAEGMGGSIQGLYLLICL